MNDSDRTTADIIYLLRAASAPVSLVKTIDLTTLPPGAIVLDTMDGTFQPGAGYEGRHACPIELNDRPPLVQRLRTRDRQYRLRPWPPLRRVHTHL